MVKVVHMCFQANVGRDIGRETRFSASASCNVEKQIPIFFIPSKILLFDKPINSLLDVRHVGNEVPAHGLNCLGFDLLVRELLTCLQHTNNRRIEIMLPVALYGALRALRLLRLQRDIIRAESEGGVSCLPFLSLEWS
jgi:hypothetical protein